MLRGYRLYQTLSADQVLLSVIPESRVLVLSHKVFEEIFLVIKYCD